MKTVDNVKADMSSLYDELKSGQIELKMASELANIAGKFLKAEQLQLAREMFMRGLLPQTPVQQPQRRARLAKVK